MRKLEVPVVALGYLWELRRRQQQQQHKHAILFCSFFSSVHQKQTDSLNGAPIYGDEPLEGMPDDNGIDHVIHGVGEGVLDELEGVVLLLGRISQTLEQSGHGLGGDVRDGTDGRLGFGVELEVLVLLGHIGKDLET